MIKNILELLKYANGETELIRIAQGKYKLPTTLNCYEGCWYWFNYWCFG